MATPAKAVVPTVLGPNGQPVAPPEDDERKEMRAQGTRVLRSFQTYLTQLGMQVAGVDPSLVAQRPNEAHAWVYAASMVQAINVGGVPFQVMQETDAAGARREARAKRAGRKLVRGRYNKRRYRHHLSYRGRKMGMRSKDLEADPDHPVQALLDRPNPYMRGSELWMATTLFMALFGEGFWILTDADNKPFMPTPAQPLPERMWLVAPNRMTELLNQNELVGWEMVVPRGLPIAPEGTRVRLQRSEVIHFKYPDPTKPFRGLAPISAAARGITLDLATAQTNFSTVMNGASPSGILTTDDWLDENQREEVADWWAETHSGPNNAGVMPIMFGGLKFQGTGLSPRDMEYLESRRWNRDEILGVLGTTKAAVGVTDDLNYATQLSQDKNLWTKRLLPLLMIYEDEINNTLLAPDTDATIGMFDITGVDALRLGLDEQVDIATKLSDKNLHMPPTDAMAMAGLEPPEYEGDDVAFVPAGLLPASEVANVTLEDLKPPPPTSGPAGPNEEDEVEEVEDEEIDDPQTNGAPNVGLALKRKARGGHIWRQLMASVEVPYEKRFARDWRRYVREERSRQLALFDEVTGLATRAAGKTGRDYDLKVPLDEFRMLWNGAAKTKADPSEVPDGLDFDELIVPLTQAQNALREATRMTLAAGGEATFNVTAQELGGPQVVTYGFDDPKVQRALKQVEDRLVGTTPVTLQRQLRRSLREGLENAETLGQLRQRVQTVYNSAAGPSKTLQVARTESGSMLNNVRRAMHERSGVTLVEWTTAADEVVRSDHVVFGASDPVAPGFNYMTLVGKEGTLRYPQDLAGPADQVINCRCVHVAPL